MNNKALTRYNSTEIAAFLVDALPFYLSMTENDRHYLSDRIASALQCQHDDAAREIDSCRLSPLWMSHYDDLAKRTSVGNALATLLLDLAHAIRTQEETP